MTLFDIMNYLYVMTKYEVMKEDAILGPFDINQIEEFVRAGLILKRDYAYDIEYPDSFRTVDFS